MVEHVSGKVFKHPIIFFDDIKDLENYSGRWLTEKVGFFIEDMKKNGVNEYEKIAVRQDIYELIKQHYLNKQILDDDIKFLKTLLIIPVFVIKTVEFS